MFNYNHILMENVNHINKSYLQNYTDILKFLKSAWTGNASSSSGYEAKKTRKDF